MQKILRINLNARTQALRRARRKHLQNVKTEWSEYEQHFIAAERARTKAIKTERANRREDWIAGPLAPRRDVGLQQNIYGTIDHTLARGPNVPESGRLDWLAKKNSVKAVNNSESEANEDSERGEILGNAKNIIVGDRVCVIRGREGVKGKIGKVKDVHLERNEITVVGVNMADVRVPSMQSDSLTTPFTTAEVSIPLIDVRLVFRHTVIDDATGQVLKDRDVIVDNIRGGAPYLEREQGSSLPEHTRYVLGQDIEIPWPEAEITQYSPFESDTRRREVEETTYMPSVEYPPLTGPSVVDELISRYAKKKAWHDEEFVRMKIIEDARARWYESRTLDTPAVEYKKWKIEQAKQKSEQRQAEIEALLSSTRALGLAEVEPNLESRDHIVLSAKEAEPVPVVL